MKPPVRVLIVDDSAVVRQTISELLASDLETEVMGVASDLFVAVERIRDEITAIAGAVLGACK